MAHKVMPVLQNGDDYTYSYGAKFSLRDSSSSDLELESEQIIQLTGDIYFKRTNNCRQHLIEGYCLLGKYIHMSQLEEDALFEHLENDLMDNVVGDRKHMLLQSACIIPDAEEPFHSTFKVIYFYNCNARCFAVNDYSDRAHSACRYCCLLELENQTEDAQIRQMMITREELEAAGVTPVPVTPKITILQSPPTAPARKPRISRLVKFKDVESGRKLRYSPYASANAEMKADESKL